MPEKDSFYLKICPNFFEMQPEMQPALRHVLLVLLHTQLRVGFPQTPWRFFDLATWRVYPHPHTNNPKINKR